MTSRPPQTLPQDTSVEHSRSRHASDGLSLLNSTDPASLKTAVVDSNRQNVLSNQSIPLSYDNLHHGQDNDANSDTMTLNPPISSATHPQFRTHVRTPTIAASPQQSTDLTSEVLTESHDDNPGESYLPNHNGRSSLRITTDIRSQSPLRYDSNNTGQGSLAPSGGQHLVERRRSSSLRPIQRTPSLKQAIANSIGSACSSAVPSPLITAMGDITPLPSPLLISDSPGPWRRLGMRPPSREAPPILPSPLPGSALVTANGESISSALANQSKRKAYVGLKANDAPPGLGNKAEPTHGRNRSVSEYVPDPLAIPKRQTTVSGSHPRAEVGTHATDDKHLRREPHLGPTRGLVPSHKPPTPPPSESSQSNDGSTGQSRKPKAEYFEAYGRQDKKLRRWRAIKQLGEGTFSRVVLATSHVHIDENETPKTPVESESDLRSLVAVKVCEHGPRGGASEDRIEMSLKRELEIMQTLHHPSLVHLKAWNIEPTRALLVLSYCPGGDLFDLAARHKELLTPPLLRRIFAELVGAVRYLHERRIVHRDIKLENVLVNIPVQQLADPKQDWATYPDSVITLTDLGLSRRVADDEKLETRCGSDDYAAPEVILGQPYDGKAIDAWSMGVLLYALLESRLPFDPPPGAPDALRMRSRTSHRIARVEWRWIEYTGDDGDHECDDAKFEAKGLTGAKEVTEGLLKRARSRWTLEKVAETDWVKGGIKVEGGPKFKEEEEGEEVL